MSDARRRRSYLGLLVLALVVPACGGDPAPGAASTASASSGPTPLIEGLILEAGTYELRLEPKQDLHPLRVTFTVPEGWKSWAFGVVPAEGGADAPAGRGLGFWVIDEVYADPCRWTRGMVDPPVGPGVDDLVATLVEQRGRYASTPTDVTLAGYAGTRIDVQVPPDIDFSDCSHSEFHSWTNMPSGGRYHQGPGQIDRLWILDVDGDRLVVGASFFPETSPEDRAELWQIIDSVRIDRPGTPEG